MGVFEWRATDLDDRFIDVEIAQRGRHMPVWHSSRWKHSSLKLPLMHIFSYYQPFLEFFDEGFRSVFEELQMRWQLRPGCRGLVNYRNHKTIQPIFWLKSSFYEFSKTSSFNNSWRVIHEPCIPAFYNRRKFVEESLEGTTSLLPWKPKLAHGLRVGFDWLKTYKTYLTMKIKIIVLNSSVGYVWEIIQHSTNKLIFDILLAHQRGYGSRVNNGGRNIAPGCPEFAKGTRFRCNCTIWEAKKSSSNCKVLKIMEAEMWL